MFKTKDIEDFYLSLPFSKIYQLLNLNSFNSASKVLDKSKDIILKKKSELSSELELNDLYLLKAILYFHYSLVSMWDYIYQGKFSKSWNELQNTLDTLRTIKRFSNSEINEILKFFENQLLDIEKLYPYKIFVSVGWELGFYECSICHKDIDSFECPHELGELYMGEMAKGNAKNMLSLNHVALVENPKDKRCVIEYDDTGEAFKVFQYIQNMLQKQKLSPLMIESIDFQKKLFPNEKYIKLNRNEKCFCGSNKKFKRCCIDKEFEEKDHAELILGYSFLNIVKTIAFENSFILKRENKICQI